MAVHLFMNPIVDTVEFSVGVPTSTIYHVWMEQLEEFKEFAHLIGPHAVIKLGKSKKFQKSVNIYAEKTKKRTRCLGRLELSTTKGKKRQLRICLHPGQVAAKELKNFYELLWQLMGVEYEVLYSTISPTRLDFAIDVGGIKVADHFLCKSRVRCSLPTDAYDKQYQRLGSPRSKWSVKRYNKFAQLLVNGIEPIWKTLVRTEVTIRRPGLPIPQLIAELKNPFDDTWLVDAQKAKASYVHDSKWQYFVEACIANGSAMAFGHFSKFLRDKYRKRLKMFVPYWWVPSKYEAACRAALNALAPAM